VRPSYPGIKCPATLLVGEYRLTHEARAYHNNNARRLWRVAGRRGLDFWQWPKGDGVRSGGANRAAACKMHNIVKFHYRYNNAGLIRRAIHEGPDGRVPGRSRVTQCALWRPRGHTWIAYIWNSLRSVPVLVSRLCSGNYWRRVWQKIFVISIFRLTFCSMI